MVKRISPSQSPTPPTVVSSGATRVIQLGNRFIRPQVAPLVRASPAAAGASGATTVRVATPIVRAAAPAGPSVVQWPSQPLTSPQLQDLFQRPRAPVQRVQGPIVRTILVPRPSPASSSSGTTNLTVTTSQQPQQTNVVNTPLPNIQLPSEPVPISPQVNSHSTFSLHFPTLLLRYSSLHYVPFFRISKDCNNPRSPSQKVKKIRSYYKCNSSSSNNNHNQIHPSLF